MRNSSRNKGFTLLEMAVVLAIIAILAAILTPIVTSYIDQARSARANEDVAKIAQSFNLHYRDTGKYPIWDTTAAANTGTTPSRNCLVSGNSAVLPSGGVNDTSWTTSTAPCTGNNIGLLQNYLNLNSLGVATGNPANGQIAYRGPYLDGLDANDPWGQPYVVTSAWLATSGAQAAFWAFSISAGPNGQLDTNQKQTARGAGQAVITTSGDDITALIH
jgi:prepilin-type N-terminal cleavage/methylation domain-containing protein